MTDALRLEAVPFADPDAVALRTAMVQEVTQVYGGQRDHGSDEGAKGIDPDAVVVTVVGHLDGLPVAQGLVRRLGDDLEIKRMYVAPAARGRGAASALLLELERHCRAEGASRIVLHTGERQTSAIRTYERHGYTPIPVDPPYVGMPASLCFEKVL